MDFCAALAAAKAGKTVARGTPETPTSRFTYVSAAQYDEVNWLGTDTLVPWQGCIVAPALSYSMNGTDVPATDKVTLWVPNMADIVATDWFELEV